MAESEKKLGAVYAGWTTFKNVIDSFSRSLPTRIDKSVFHGQSGGVQAQLMAALRFLELIDEAGAPQPLLKQLAKAQGDDEKRPLIAAMLKKSYSALFDLDLMLTTPSMVSETMTGTYGVSGETKEKAIRFFLSAAKFAEIPVSDLVSKSASSSNVGTRQPKKKNFKKEEPTSTQQAVRPMNAHNANSGMTTTIGLSSGGHLSVSLHELNLFELSDSDRDFVWKLIQQVKSYGKEDPE